MPSIRTEPIKQSNGKNEEWKHAHQLNQNKRIEQQKGLLEPIRTIEQKPEPIKQIEH